MICTKCSMHLAKTMAKSMLDCPVCGTPLVPTITDILDDNAYNLVRERRPEQIRMAKDVEALLTKEQGTLLAEGGTGLGKSYAYIIPTILKVFSTALKELAAPEKGVTKKRDEGSVANKAIIATPTKALQHHIYKDLETITKALQIPLSISLYLGKANYACKLLSQGVPPNDLPTYKNFIETSITEAKPACIENWPGTAPYWWPMISAENCKLGTECSHYATCRPSKNVDVLVVNHATLAIGLTRLPTLFSMLIVDTLIVDEAHQLEDYVLNALTYNLDLRNIVKYVERFMKDPQIRNFMLETEGVGYDYTTTLTEKSLKTLEGIVLSVRNSRAVHYAYNPQTYRDAFLEVVEDLSALYKHYALLADKAFEQYVVDKKARALNSYTNDTHPPEYYLVVSSGCTRFCRYISNIVQALLDPLNGSDPENETQNRQYVTTVSPIGEVPALKSQPLFIASHIEPGLNCYAHKVFTSATLAAGSDYKSFLTPLGLPLETPVQIYKSTYDISAKSLLYLAPLNTPLPNNNAGEERDKWLSAIAHQIRQLCNMTNGGAFILCASNQDRDQLHHLISKALEGDGLHVRIQDGAIEPYVAGFRARKNGVLFGSTSLWEGIDVAGDSLRCVIIPRLPFPHFYNALYQAKTDALTRKGLNAFTELSVPAMIRRTRQGAGRLIRTDQDRGIVAILDPRFWTGGVVGKHHTILSAIIAKATSKDLNVKAIAPVKGGYGDTLIQLLGFTKITNNITIAQRWYKTIFTDTP